MGSHHVASKGDVCLHRILLDFAPKGFGQGPRSKRLHPQIQPSVKQPRAIVLHVGQPEAKRLVFEGLRNLLVLQFRDGVEGNVLP